MTYLTHTHAIFLALIPLLNNPAHSSTLESTNARITSMFTFTGLNRSKVVVYNEDMANEFVNTEKPKGLHKTTVDLDFPQVTTATSTIYRIVQYVMNGSVTEFQRELYKNAEFKIKGHRVHGSVRGPCKIDVVLKLTPPSNFTMNGVYVPSEEGMERVFSLNKDETKVVKFENVFDDDFPMEHFWANFKVTGKCNMYLDVELLKPNNTTDAL